MNADTRKSIGSRRLVPTLALVLSALFLLTLPPVGIGATGPAREALQELQMVRVRAQGATDADVPLAGADQWAQVSVEIGGAPDGAVVSSVQVKYNIVYPKPADLEVQLVTSGAGATYTLWDKGSAGDAVLAQSTGEITALQGVPVNGTWSLAVQGGDAEGYIDDFSIIVYYEAGMPTLRIEGGAAPGVPAILHRPEGVMPATPPADDDEKPNGGSSVVPQDVPPGAIIIGTENFEGAFPTDPWLVVDNSNDGYERYWDDAFCDQCGGDWAAWPADGGRDRVDPCAGTNYPNNLSSWMIYGPFDLSDATNAGTEFGLWYDTELNYDYVFVGVSHDGYEFYGYSFSGYDTCAWYNFYYPDFVGDPSVWVAWMFYSDGGVRDRGSWVDDIIIWKEAGWPTVRIDPPERYVNENAPFTFNVVIDNASDLGGFEFDLTYGPACVTATDATMGSFLGSTGRGVGELGPTLGSGVIGYGGYSWGTTGTGPYGSGVLATISFNAGSNECSSSLHLQNVSLTDTYGNPQSPWLSDGTVHVQPGCPAPNCPEDLNCDGVVNIVDVMLVASKWGRACPTR